ncbi:MAG: DEAD/DEAH box helicase [Candidatus Hodarchaeales archaeon]|jgi:DEAD/DEAH box helicase domain-containing protein
MLARAKLRGKFRWDSITHFLERLQRDPGYREQICHIEHFPEKQAKHSCLNQPLALGLRELLRKQGINLYTHQAEAINHLLQGENVIITTPTASGKSLCYTIPILNTLLEDPNTSALLLYPTKALANDQLATIKDYELTLELNSQAAIYDGDTPTSQRAKIRNQSRIILSNPYAIHQYLDWHPKWARFLRTLRFVVVDEAHTYRGIFGSHCAQLFRRLRRLCQRYGANPQFVLCSATVANAEELAVRIVGKPFQTVSEDGSPQGTRTFVFWNPPFINDKQIVRRSPHQETRDLLRAHVLMDLQTLCFTPSRRMAELIAMWTAQDLEEGGFDANLIAAYRAGYLPTRRRLLEKQLRTREIMGMATTNALEVGIDVGSLDAVIISGFPGTIISAHQQAGRAGRGLNDSLCTLIWFEDPLNQFYAQHPELFFGKSPEHAIVDLDNPYILAGHLLCASAESPLTFLELKQFWPPQALQTLRGLQKQGLVKNTPWGWTFVGEERPANIVQLAGAFGESLQILWNGALLETISLPQAYREAHEGAVLLHQGETYIVEELDLPNRLIHVQKREVNHYTEALKHTAVQVLEVLQEEERGFRLKMGKVKVTEEYYGYRIKSHDEVVGFVTLNLPPLEYETVALWLELPDDLKALIFDQERDLSGGLHAAEEHVLIAMTPMIAMCDRGDIGGFSTVSFGTDEKSAIILYDIFPGGIGIVEKCFEQLETLMAAAQELIQDCPCERGCPSCIQSPKCGSNNEPLDKEIGLVILRELLWRLQNPTTNSN